MLLLLLILYEILMKLFIKNKLLHLNNMLIPTTKDSNLQQYLLFQILILKFIMINLINYYFHNKLAYVFLLFLINTLMQYV